MPPLRDSDTVVFGEGSAAPAADGRRGGARGRRGRVRPPVRRQGGATADARCSPRSASRGRTSTSRNVLKCRPPENRPPGARRDRRPAALPREQIRLLAPELLLLLGNARRPGPSSGRTAASRRSAGGSPTTPEGVGDLPTYHPAYLLRTPGAKAEAWLDLQLGGVDARAQRSPPGTPRLGESRRARVAVAPHARPAPLRLTPRRLTPRGSGPPRGRAGSARAARLARDAARRPPPPARAAPSVIAWRSPRRPVKTRRRARATWWRLTGWWNETITRESTRGERGEHARPRCARRAR